MRTKSAYLDKTVILEGCNGEWAQERYLPLLVDRAANGGCELWAIDLDDGILLTNDKIQESWTIAQARGQAHYLSKLKDKQSYNKLLDATHVFIVTPDQYHCQIAEFWLERLAPNGKIFIEKPLDASMRSADELRKDIKRKKQEDTIFMFDHYLARARPLMEDWPRYLKLIGGIEKIDASILESSTIKPNRVKTLEKGIIFDLFGHILALSGALIEQNLTPSPHILQKVEIKGVKAAQYLNSPISGETFSEIRFNINNVAVTGSMGQGVGREDNKEMTVYGSKGIINLDFQNDTFACNPEGQPKSRGKLEARHVETFLEELIGRNKQSISIPGVLDFDAAFEILSILNKAKAQMGKMADYQAGETTDNILKKF